MSNAYDDMRSAVEQARHTMAAADNCANTLADILRHDGRLRKLSAIRLEDLKRQLTNYNSRTRKWKP